ncbi:hypothetical protein M9H77_28756 [Catharanthus roseus]|uniref:Uncharacterized protein n=1 Tax=Catharanthus roseus TaxID=4058 RepID=A0ACC0AKJ7_CATRO|nr:hypothetical protein M9H77_28756 [Catharanthus roseus]
MTEANHSDLLNQLEHILDSDPLIDEVGFIHPSQFDALLEEADSPSSDKTLGSKESKANPTDSVFWSRDHKLGISTSVLLPLYGAAKHAFMEALQQYKMHNDSGEESNFLKDENASISASLSRSIVEGEVMKHSRALLLLSCDLGTAWNSRKLVLSKKQQFQLFVDELLLSSLVLSYAPKSESAWAHRRWAIRMIAGRCSNLEEIVERESELVEKIAEKSKMNYRAWNHRSWLVSYMSAEQVLKELNKSRDWAGLNVADNSCFQYRARLLLRLLNSGSLKQHDDVCTGAAVHELWKKELDWLETLIRRYVGREALWLHRRVLSLCWIKLLHGNSSSSCPRTKTDLEIYMDKELSLCSSCSVIPDNHFEDFQTQATLSARYIMWLIMQLPAPFGIEYQKKIEANGLKKVLNNLSPERNFLWDTLTANILPISSDFHTS